MDVPINVINQDSIQCVEQADMSLLIICIVFAVFLAVIMALCIVASSRSSEHPIG